MKQCFISHSFYVININSFLLGKKKRLKIFRYNDLVDTTDSMAYDDVDKKILELLSGNSRLSVRQISKIIKVSPPTISRRIRRLEEKGVIKGYVSIIEDEELGYDCRALLLVKMSGNSDPDMIIEKMRNNDRICNLYQTVGNYDIISTATCTKLEGLSDFIEELRTIEGIAWIDSVLITSREKVLKKILTNRVTETAKIV